MVTELIFAVLLTTLPQDSDLDRLVRRMGAEEYDVRDVAMGSLYRHGKKAVPVLRRALRSRDPEIGARARFLLNLLRDQIQPGDVLDVTVEGEPELSRTGIFVLPDGVDHFPYIGKVMLAGRTPEELEEELTVRYGKLLKRPRVRIKVYRRHKALLIPSLTVGNPEK